MALHPDFPRSPYAVVDPQHRWFPAPEQLRDSSMEKLIPPLVAELRRRVKEFRDGGYVGATATSKSLLQWWFDTEHLIPQSSGPPAQFQYYFAQREALETIIYLIDVAGAQNRSDLMRYAGSNEVREDMFDESWRRYVIKMATGSGKTKVMSLALAWSYFHKLYEEDSPMARNFLVIAPNIIVLDRLARDFEGLSIFEEDPVIPDDGFEGRNWRADFQMRLHRQDDIRPHGPTGNIFLTNIHRVYDTDVRVPSAADEDTTDYFLGDPPVTSTDASKVQLEDVVRDIEELMVINDEAHHVHSDKLSWFQSIDDIHNRLVQKGSQLALQLDVTATPKHTNGAIFVQTVADYPLVEAIAQDIVKHPVVPDDASQAKLSERTGQFAEQYRDFLRLGVTEWRKAYEENEKLGKKSILFVMVDDTRNCDEVAEHLRATYPEFEAEDSVLTIHTKNNGEISEAAGAKNQEELTRLRRLANEIDSTSNPYKAVVSVLMLKEGWDVRNVTTIVGLRAYSAKSNILPEQTLGRGLRRMHLDREEELDECVSVIGTPAFMDFVRTIQEEGVELERVEMGEGAGPNSTLVIEVERDNPSKDIAALDIELPILAPRIYRDYAHLDQLDIAAQLNTPVALRDLVAEADREIAFQYTAPREGADPYHHTTTLSDEGVPDYRGTIKFFTHVAMREIGFASAYNVIYGKIKEFLEHHLFGQTVDLEDADVIRNMAQWDTTEIVIETIKAALAALTIREYETVDIRRYTRLQDTRTFAAKRRNFVSPQKSVFNRIVGDSSLELQFAAFLERCSDVVAYAKNYTAIEFSLDYVREDGNISNYRPDFFVKTRGGDLVVVETKGLEDIDVPRKMERLKRWCEDVANTDAPVRPKFVFVDWDGYQRHRDRLTTFAQVTRLFTRYQ